MEIERETAECWGSTRAGEIGGSFPAFSAQAYQPDLATGLSKSRDRRQLFFLYRTGFPVHREVF